ncbi:unnamed protein product [Dovyalis caffra]|uniref:Uncharacterized protein n=1 Tax=Dovyalis caffra TaxID=77055 RepID=A0AAV1SDH9_9ROSI|nr:unnamed protein product [Dovyalis caffra]
MEIDYLVNRKDGYSLSNLDWTTKSRWNDDGRCWIKLEESLVWTRINLEELLLGSSGGNRTTTMIVVATDSVVANERLIGRLEKGFGLLDEGLLVRFGMADRSFLIVDE